MIVRVGVSIVVLLGAACSTGTTAPDSRGDLYGRWRNIEMTIYLEDGSARQQTGVECVQQLDENSSVTDCTLPNGSRPRVVSKVVAWTPHGYVLEVVEHSVYPAAVGFRTRVEYRIEGNKRYSTLYPPRIEAPGVKSPAIKIETVDIRD